MIIYPAIDIKSGRCVRLYQGCFDQPTYYNDDPVKQINFFSENGASYVHVVDLDGAKKRYSAQTELIFKIASLSNIKIQIGGGIRTKQQINQFLNNKIYRVIVGSIALTQPLLVREWLNEFDPERIVLAFDIRTNRMSEPMVAIHGWQEQSEISLWQILDSYQESPLKHVICTDIDRDGTLQGINIRLYQECRKRYPTICFQASGGIRSLNDLRELAKLSISGAIVGKAIYENKFSLSAAINMFDETNRIIS